MRSSRKDEGTKGKNLNKSSQPRYRIFEFKQMGLAGPKGGIRTQELLGTIKICVDLQWDEKLSTLLSAERKDDILKKMIYLCCKEKEKLPKNMPGECASIFVSRITLDREESCKGWFINTTDTYASRYTAGTFNMTAEDFNNLKTDHLIEKSSSPYLHKMTGGGEDNLEVAKVEDATVKIQEEIAHDLDAIALSQMEVTVFDDALFNAQQEHRERAKSLQTKRRIEINRFEELQSAFQKESSKHSDSKEIQADLKELKKLEADILDLHASIDEEINQADSSLSSKEAELDQKLSRKYSTYREETTKDKSLFRGELIIPLSQALEDFFESSSSADKNSALIDFINECAEFTLLEKNASVDTIKDAVFEINDRDILLKIINNSIEKSPSKPEDLKDIITAKIAQWQFSSALKKNLDIYFNESSSKGAFQRTVINPLMGTWKVELNLAKMEEIVKRKSSSDLMKERNELSKLILNPRESVYEKFSTYQKTIGDFAAKWEQVRQKISHNKTEDNNLKIATNTAFKHAFQEHITALDKIIDSYLTEINNFLKSNPETKKNLPERYLMTVLVRDLNLAKKNLSQKMDPADAIIKINEVVKTIKAAFEKTVESATEKHLYSDKPPASFLERRLNKQPNSHIKNFISQYRNKDEKALNSLQATIQNDIDGHKLDNRTAKKPSP